MRNECCPLCESKTDPVLQLRYRVKMNLPTEPEIRHCAIDNFLFVSGGRQQDYDEYYKSLANDSVHSELSGGNLRSPISKLQSSHIVQMLGRYFIRNRRVLDFGCGEASLLVELASEFPTSSFFGFDPGPAAETAKDKTAKLGLNNLLIGDLKLCAAHGPFDFVIVSHVIEHLLDFDFIDLLDTLLTKEGLLYVEVPNSLEYSRYMRQEFLYYFDRLHVNHFSKQSLARLASDHGFSYLKHLEYTFPYRDGGEYPALGMLFGKRGHPAKISSRSILEEAKRYISQEQGRAMEVAKQLNEYEGVLVWGAGDNFFRSIENGGPLSGLRNMVVLDRCSQKISIGGETYFTEDPKDGIRRLSWPVVISVSERRKDLKEYVRRIDPNRHVYFV